MSTLPAPGCPGTFVIEASQAVIRLNALSASERKALTLTTFTSACICFAPAELVSGVLLLLVSAALFRWDRAVTLREASITMGETPIPPAQPVVPVLAEASVAPVSPDTVGPDPAESRPAAD